MKITQDLMLLPHKKVETFFNNNILLAYEVVKQANLNYAKGQSKNAPSSFLWYDNDTSSRIIGLAAYLGDKESYPGMKWIASCPRNIERDLPRASAVIILNDFTTGFPVAIIEGAVISALRTALSAILSLEYLHSTKSIANLGIVGCGNLAITFLRCMVLLGWKIDNCQVYDNSGSQLAKMKTKLAGTVQINCVENYDHLLKSSDVVLFTTTAIKPYINDPDSFKSDAVVLNLSLRDLSPEVILASYNVVDDIEHVLAANTSPHLAYILAGNKDFIAGNIMQLISGDIRAPQNKLKIFSPMGMGILDIALANLLLNNSINNNCCVIKGFFK